MPRADSRRGPLPECMRIGVFIAPRFFKLVYNCKTFSCCISDDKNFVADFFPLRSARPVKMCMHSFDSSVEGEFTYFGGLATFCSAKVACPRFSALRPHQHAGLQLHGDAEFVIDLLHAHDASFALDSHVAEIDGKLDSLA